MLSSINTGRFLGAVAASLVIASAVQAQPADIIFGERTLALALDERCGLFSDTERHALRAARIQARGVLLRNGYNDSDLSEFAETVAGDAAQMHCQSNETRDIHSRVSDAFLAWRTLRSMDFPGDQFVWSADRTQISAPAAWVVVQEQDAVRAGVTLVNGELGFTIASALTNRFSGAVLVLRDTARAPDLYDPTEGGLFNGPAGAPWVRWSPPRHAHRMVWASERVTGERLIELSPHQTRNVFRFPEAAAQELSRRDPREAVRIDYLDHQGIPAASDYVEVGDFGAALAFVEAVVP